MLNWNDVLFYIKGRLALPSSYLEKSDEELKKWICLTALKDFSEFVPDIEWTMIDPDDNKFRTSRPSFYTIFDDEGLEIYGVREYYYSAAGMLATGHNLVPPMSMEGMKEWALSAFKSNILKPFSYWGYTAKFIKPNIIRILPEPSSHFVVEYEREHPHDLRRIPGSRQRDFMELALAETMIWIGTMRSHYGDSRIQTPFGEIPLNGDTLKSDGMELKERTKEHLVEVSIPSVIIDIG